MEFLFCGHNNHAEDRQLKAHFDLGWMSNRHGLLKKPTWWHIWILHAGLHLYSTRTAHYWKLLAHARLTSGSPCLLSTVKLATDLQYMYVVGWLDYWTLKTGLANLSRMSQLRRALHNYVLWRDLNRAMNRWFRDLALKKLLTFCTRPLPILRYSSVVACT